MHIAVFAGSFDPFTMGHFDIVSRAAKHFDKIYIGVAGKSGGKVCRLSPEDRLEIVKRSTSELSNVEVRVFDNFLVDFAVKVGANAIVRGLRTSNDFEYEKALMEVYRSQSNKIDSFFIIASHEYCHISSTIVRELATLGGDMKGYVHENVKEMVEKFYTT